MDDIAEIHEQIRVLHVEAVGKEIFVDVYGGDPALVGCLTYTIDNAAERRDAYVALHVWRSENTELVYIREDSGNARLLEQQNYNRIVGHGDDQ